MVFLVLHYVRIVLQLGVMKVVHYWKFSFIRGQFLGEV